MRYFLALVLSASLFLPATSASANVLTPADYQSFQDLDVKMLSIGDDLYALITTRPEAHAPDCLMQLAFKFDAVQADLHRIRTLVGVAANHDRQRGRITRDPPFEPCGLGICRATEISSTDT